MLTNYSIIPSIWNPARRDIKRYLTDDVWSTFFRFPEESDAASVVKTEGGYKIDLEAPGLSKSDFDVRVEDNVLMISSTQKDTTFKHRGTRYREFSLQYTLPPLTKITDITASYDAGILTVDVPIDEKKSTTYTVDVK